MEIAARDALDEGLLLFHNQAAKGAESEDRKSTRLNSSHGYISYAVFCLKKKKNAVPKNGSYRLITNSKSSLRNVTFRCSKDSSSTLPSNIARTWSSVPHITVGRKPSAC